MREIGIDNANLQSPGVKDKNYKAEKESIERDVIKYIIEDRLKPNRIRLGPKKQDFVKYSDLFKGVQKRKNYQGLANLFVPETLKSVETLVSITHFGIFASPIFMKYRGFEPSDEISAMNMTDVNYYCMGENQFELSFMPFERGMYTYGTAVGKITWDFREREVSVLSKEGQKETKLETYRDVWLFQNVDLLNFWIPPETPWNDIQQAEWLAETESVDSSWIKQKSKVGWISKVKGNKLLLQDSYKGNFDEGKNLKEQRLQSSNITGHDKKKPFLIATWYGLIPNKFVKDEGDIEDDEDLVLGLAVIENDEIVLKLAKVKDIYWHNSYPYVSSVFVPIENEFFGMGVVQIVESLQEELNDTRNQSMDNKTANNMSMWLMDKNAQIARKDLELRPNGVIPTMNMQGLQRLAPALFTGESITIEGIVKEDIRQAVAAISGLQGSPQPGVGSATEFQGLQNAGMSRSKMVIKTLAECALKPIFTMVKYLIYQFYDHKKMMRVVGAKGIKTKFIGPDEVVGSYDVALELSTDFEKNPNVLRQQLLTAFSQLIPLPSETIQRHWKLISKILLELGIKNPEEYYPDLVPVDQESLLSPSEVIEVLLESQVVRASKGDDHIAHIQALIEFRGRTYLSLPPYILNNLDNLIKEHQGFIQQQMQAQQMQMMQMAMMQGQGQSPNSNKSTMQSPTSDNQISKGVENV